MKRQTIQRSIVLEAVKKLQSHATADEIYAFIAKTTPDISRSTVYRNLNSLSMDGLIRKVSIPDEADRFDHICFNHYHVRCEKCGKVFDVDMEYIPDMSNKIRDMHGFRITSHDIFFSGICPECQRQEKTS